MNRRGFLTSLLATLALPVAVRAQRAGPAAAPADRWPQFRGTPSLTGLSSSSVPATLKRAWIWEGGESIDSSPAIVDGVVFVGTGTGELVALALADGALKWRYKAGESIGESSPAVAGGRAFIGDLEGTVHAVDGQTGKGLWTFKTRSEIKSSPIVAGEMVLIGSYDGGLYALDASDGKERWTLKTENYVHGTPSLVEGVAYFAGCDEKFHAVRVRDGRELFAASATAYTGASVAIAGDAAYFGTFDNQVIGFDLKKRRVVWRYEHPDRKFPFYSYLASGKVLSEYEDGSALTSSPAIASGRVAIASTGGRVICFA